MSVARKLAERITSTRYEDLPREAIEWSRIAILDTVGVTIAGAVEEAPAILEDVLGIPAGAGQCLVFGSKRRVGPLDAALLNGVSSHTLDFDNTSNTMAGHASAVMIPALIAAAEAYGGTGADLLLAHTVGFETGARFGQGLNFHHHEKGWHPTSTLGVFAVTAACSRLLGLTADQTANALGMATSLAAGIKANFGTMVKPLHAGQCARAGLMAALLARKGFTANADAFEHKQGFFNVFNGAGNYDAERITASWGAPFDVTGPGAAYKLYACCAGVHAAVEAVLNLVQENGGVFDPATIERVDAWTPRRRLAHTDRPQPASALDAKFSVQYCVARALLDGRVVFPHFEGTAYREPRITALLPRIHAAPHKAGQFAPDNNNGAEVQVTLRDGRVLAAKVERALGRTAQNPIPLERLEAKFEDCASRVLDTRAIAAALDALGRFETLRSMKEFTALLEPDAANRAGRRALSVPA